MTIILLLLWIVIWISMFSDGLTQSPWKGFLTSMGPDPQVEDHCDLEGSEGIGRGGRSRNDSDTLYMCVEVLESK